VFDNEKVKKMHKVDESHDPSCIKFEKVGKNPERDVRVSSKVNMSR